VGLDTSSSVPLATNFWLATSQGDVWSFGGAGSYGSAAGLPLSPPDRRHHAHPRRQRLLVGGERRRRLHLRRRLLLRSTGAIALNKPIVAMAPTPDGNGYWLVAATAHLHFRRRVLLRLDRRHRAEQTDRGHGTHSRRQGLLVGGERRRHLHFGDALTPARPVPLPPPIGGEGGAERFRKGYWIEDQNGSVQPLGMPRGATPHGVDVPTRHPRDKSVLYAFSQLGKPYIWGGNGRSVTTAQSRPGVMAARGGISFARVSADQYHTAGSRLPRCARCRGPRLLGHQSDRLDTVYHTAIYVGGTR